MSHLPIRTRRGVIGSGDDYSVRWYRISYAYDGWFPEVCFKMNVPDAAPTDVARVVFFILGGSSPDVTCVESANARLGGFHTGIAGLLASNDDITTPARDLISAATVPIVTVQFNAPGRAPAPCAFDVSSDGDPNLAGSTPTNANGSDEYGEMSLAAIAAIIDAVEETIETEWPGLDIVKVVASHSNGIVLGSRLASERDDIHAYIDAEGPTDSLEQTVSTECFDFFGTFPEDVYGSSCVAPPATLDLAGWIRCAGLRGGLQEPLRANQCGGHWVRSTQKTFFESAWGKFFRPPEDLLDEATAELNAGVRLPQPAANTGSGMNFDWATVTSGEVTAFWSERRPLMRLEQRKTPYIRINCRDDHAQPRHYRNRHATRALLAAASCDSTECPASDVYWLKTVSLGDPIEPVRFSAEGVDADSKEGVLDWPTSCGPVYDPATNTWTNTVDVPSLMAAAIRWAFQQEFGYTGLRDCVNRCGADPYCDDDDARLACVQACLEAERRLHPDTTEQVTAWYGYASFSCGGLFGAVEDCADRYCDYDERMACIGGALDEFGVLRDFFRDLAEEEYPLVFSSTPLPGCGPVEGLGPRREQGWQGPGADDATGIADNLCDLRCTGANRGNWGFWCLKHCDGVDNVADSLPRGVSGDDPVGWQDFDFDEWFGDALRPRA